MTWRSIPSRSSAALAESFRVPPLRVAEALAMAEGEEGPRHLEPRALLRLPGHPVEVRCALDLSLAAIAADARGLHPRCVGLDVWKYQVVRRLMDERVVMLQIHRDDEVSLGDHVREVVLIEKGNEHSLLRLRDVGDVFDPKHDHNGCEGGLDLRIGRLRGRGIRGMLSTHPARVREVLRVVDDGLVFQHCQVREVLRVVDDDGHVADAQAEFMAAKSLLCHLASLW
eukprot:CAMPEP_0206063482 /NCGR_PEP_ID=MMETSP1466-20131121/58249_1 /ASSEMBLY_ACC=CAM_ASM_001126 /TAXON_ID=44452 /ORGANISM="Pavlova gyrans, Strain CCMP608" /LENGTH=226 /DNA_ID=CAMNT_0053438851 /DNA_START=833 /DNA_END=1513 /DNA_ORIENTATION=+